MNEDTDRPPGAGTPHGFPTTPADPVCTPIRTHILTDEDSLEDVLRTYIPTDRPVVAAVISEKAAVNVLGLAEPIADYDAGPLAALLIRFVRPRPNSRGISVPQKMQYVLEHTGAARILAAAAVSAVTRPLGIKGMFYRVAVPLSRDLDGGRPPFEHLLFPPMTPSAARAVCDDLAARLGYPVAIIDFNDYGGSIRGVSAGGPSHAELMRLLAHNPLGQRDAHTPVGVLN